MPKQSLGNSGVLVSQPNLKNKINRPCDKNKGTFQTTFYFMFAAQTGSMLIPEAYLGRVNKLNKSKNCF